jgi:hypothetical protein
MVMSPTAGFPLLVGAVILAGISALKTSKVLRVFAVAVLLAGFLAAWSRYAEFRDDYGAYLKRAKNQGTKSTDATGTGKGAAQ